jgi:hypothetical protein
MSKCHFLEKIKNGPLGRFLKDEKTLLYDFNGFGVADHFLLLFDDGCTER